MTARLRAQWNNPTDIFSILLLAGGDVVHSTLAQLSGNTITPIPFSFGWVAYSLNALCSAVGENKLMPEPGDRSLLVINGRTGYARQNQSWVLGRIFRDFDDWKDAEIDLLDQQVKSQMRGRKMPDENIKIGLRLCLYRASADKIAGKPSIDIWWQLGFVITALQLFIASVPWWYFESRQWLTFFVTATGTLLIYAFGALPQWRLEKWSCRRHTSKIVVLTQGNGFKDCLVIFGDGYGLDLEQLASARNQQRQTTRVAAAILAFGWLCILISIAGFSQHTWYIVGLGCMGLFWNVFVAGIARHPSTQGIHLDYQGVIQDSENGKAMQALALAEQDYPSLGTSLLPIFFPGALWDREVEWWDYARRRAKRFLTDPKAPIPLLPPLRGTSPIPTELVYHDVNNPPMTRKVAKQ